VSRRLLQKRFADVLGRGVSREVHRLRVEAAKRLLQDREQTIDQIARASGFVARLPPSALPTWWNTFAAGE
jgi:transcriptional regulator GlxA family with amidase domain